MKTKPAQARRTNSGEASPTQIPSGPPLGAPQSQESELSSLRSAIVARLATHRDFRGVTIGGPDIAALARVRSVAKVHLIGAVHITGAVPRGGETARPYLDPVKITVRWVADVRRNKSGKSAQWCAKRTAAILKNWTPGIAGGFPLRPAGRPREPLAFLSADPGKPHPAQLDGCDVNFQTRVDLRPVRFSGGEKMDICHLIMKMLIPARSMGCAMETIAYGLELCGYKGETPKLMRALADLHGKGLANPREGRWFVLRSLIGLNERVGSREAEDAALATLIASPAVGKAIVAELRRPEMLQAA